MAKRNFDEIDVLKGILIFLVVLGHLSVPFNREIYYFHMPAFFMISGFLHKPKIIDKFNPHFLWITFKRYLIPYVSFLLLVTVVDFFLSNNTLTLNFIIKLIYGGKALNGVQGTFWFLTTLVFIIFVFNLLESLFSQKAIVVIILILYFLGFLVSMLIYEFEQKLFIPWNFDVSLIGLFFYFIGTKFRSWFNQNKISRNIHLISVLILLSLIVLIISFESSHVVDLKYQKYGDPFKLAFYAVIFTAFLVYISHALVQLSFTKFILSLVGKASLVIMFLHLIFIKYLKAYFLNNTYINAFIVVLICVGVYLLIKTNRLTSFLFLGKKM